MATAPAQPQPIDYNALLAQANAGGGSLFNSMLAAQIKAYPQIEGLQLGTIDKIAGKLSATGTPAQTITTGKGKKQTTTTIAATPGNQYTLGATNAIDAALAQRAGIEGQASNLSGLGQIFQQQGQDQLAAAGPSSIEQTLYDQTRADLSLGRTMSAEELRNSDQAARTAFAARGLGVGSGAAGAEILNRDANSQARLQQRQAAAASADQLLTNAVIARQNQAGNFLSQAGAQYGNAGQLLGQSANLGLAGSSAYLNADPYQRALGQNVSSSTLGAVGGMANAAWNSSTGLAADVAGFNTNMQASLYNSYMNNQAALQGANLSANAALQAGQASNNSALLGAGIGAIGSLAGAGIIAF